MWISAKILIPILAFWFRLLWSTIRWGSSGEREVMNGTEFFVQTHTNEGTIDGTTFWIRMNSKSDFKFTVESRFDRWMKQIGVATEFQTGDKYFDDRVYIATDSRTLHEELRINATARSSILELLKYGGWVGCRRSILEARFQGDHSENRFYAEHFIELFDQLKNLDEKRSPRWIDSFAYQVRLVEAVVWGLAAYAMIGFFELVRRGGDLHLDVKKIATVGIYWGLIGACLLFAVIATWLRGSSRGHRIMAESALVLFLTFSCGGVALVSDINTRLDNSPSEIFQMKVSRHWIEDHGESLSYRIEVQPISGQNLVGQRVINLSGEDYFQVRNGGRVEIEIGRGRLEHPWFRSFRFSE